MIDTLKMQVFVEFSPWTLDDIRKKVVFVDVLSG